MGTVDGLVDLWRASPRVVVLTGAGISTDSGISDFRGPNGLWTRNPAAQAMFDIQTYMRDPEIRRMAWANRRENPSWTAEPNRGHHALAGLQRAGHLDTLLTQNIDGLHQRAGSTDVLELHGTIWEVSCLSCGGRWPTPEVLARPEPDPPCLLCGGILKTATISFGQPLDADVLDSAFLAASRADLLVAIGTSLQVSPVAGLAGVAPSLAIVNAEPTPYDEDAEVIFRDSISDVLDEVHRCLA
ncbi:MAG TPA: Sir2 family NAD-dependent protein deacetylase [Candidatus Limnocylindrales bacterium]|nr:Sir2 family NAD-dependent protein deacetylase [Candidatus Limnocylindrales bacterium]